MTSVNPLKQNKNQSDRTVAKASINQGFVVNQNATENTVEIQPIGEGKSSGEAFSTRMRPTVMSDGDIAVPDSDADQTLYAIYARVNNNTPFVLGYYYSDTDHDIPQANAGERKLGHQLTDSEIYFQSDGTIRIESAGGATVELTAGGDTIINNGTTGVIHDISTTTDSDGHVTSITLERRSDILI